MVATPDRAKELEEVLDELSFQLTTARSAGVHKPEELRDALKVARSLITDADHLAVTIAAERRKNQ